MLAYRVGKTSPYKGFINLSLSLDHPFFEGYRIKKFIVSPKKEWDINSKRDFNRLLKFVGGVIIDDGYNYDVKYKSFLAYQKGESTCNNSYIKERYTDELIAMGYDTIYYSDSCYDCCFTKNWRRI